MSKLQRPCLVLNRNFQAISVTTVEKAIIQVAKQVAKILDPTTYQQFAWGEWSSMAPADGEAVLRSMRAVYRVPEIIVLTRYDRLPSKKVAFSRINVYKRDGWKCQYCGKKPARDDISIDHVNPRALGGVSSFENCVLACTPCNAHKRDRTPQGAGMKLLREPKRPAWRPAYAGHPIRLESWSNFVSDSYWSVPLVD